MVEEARLFSLVLVLFLDNYTSRGGGIFLSFGVKSLEQRGMHDRDRLIGHKVIKSIKI